MKYRKQLLGICLSSVFILHIMGCQKTPEVEYITNKEGQGTLIEDNAIADNGIPIAEQLNVPEHVTKVSEETNLCTTLQFVADVTVPETTALPVYTMARCEINEERIESWTKCLFDDEVYNYDYGNSEGYISKEELERDIAYWEDVVNRAVVVESVTDSSGWDDETLPIQMTQEEYMLSQQHLEEYMQTWAALTDTPGYDISKPINYTMEPFTTEIVTGMGENMTKETLDYTYDVASFIGIKNEKQYVFSIARDDVSTHMAYGIHMSEEQVPGYKSMEIMYKPLSESVNNLTCKYSEEEAIDMCEELLSDMGMTDLVATQVEKQCMFVREENKDKEIGAGYAIWFYRNYGTVSDDYIVSDGDLLGVPEISLLEYTFMFYDYEKEEIVRNGNREFAMFFVSDDGIIGGQWVNPMKVVSCQAENVKLLDFESVLNQGMIHLENQYSDIFTEEGKKGGISITDIRLHYALMQSPYVKEEYTMIPVWDFNFEKNNNNSTTYITINAIDGSVFDREEGY